jgi:hypothetical protein
MALTTCVMLVLGNFCSMRFRALLVAAICILASYSVGKADCLSIDRGFEIDNKKKNVSKILEYGRCIKEEQKQRVGKWFCYVSHTAGIQKNDNSQIFSGAIKPLTDKFFVTISAINDDAKQMACEWGEYGLNGNLGNNFFNHCLANFKIEFSPNSVFFNTSADSYTFLGTFGDAFVLYGTNDFVWFGSGGADTSYVSHGRCEKIN